MESFGNPPHQSSKSGDSSHKMRCRCTPPTISPAVTSRTTKSFPSSWGSISRALGMSSPPNRSVETTLVVLANLCGNGKGRLPQSDAVGIAPIGSNSKSKESSVSCVVVVSLSEWHQSQSDLHQFALVGHACFRFRNELPRGMHPFAGFNT